MSARRVDTLVVGGGAMGSAAAWHLARRGVEVVLLERFEPGHHNGASHGTSRIFRTSYPEPTYVALAQEAGRLWRELEDESSTPLLTVTGGVDHGDHPLLAATAEALDTLGIDVERLDPAEAHERWPGLAFDKDVYHFPQNGRLHADHAVSALQTQAAHHGADVRFSSRVLEVRPVDDDAVVVRTETETLHARRVIVAAGGWASHLLGEVVPLPSITVTQEQPAHFAPHDPAAVWPAFGHLPHPDRLDDAPFGGIYGLDSGAEGVKVGFHGVGPVVDPDHRDFLPEPRQLEALRDYVRRWVPGVDADAATPISCTYATTPDSNFVIDRHGPIVVAAGFSGHGFKFVPAVGRLLADLAAPVPRPAPSIFSFDRHDQRKASA